MSTFAKATADEGGLAQLARAPALHAGGQRFESVILHLLLAEASYGGRSPHVDCVGEYKRRQKVFFTIFMKNGN